MNPTQQGKNRKTARVLASVAAALFLGYLLRYWLIK